MTAWIRTRRGKLIEPLNLRQEDVDVEEMAWALSNINRFNGHARYPINVAHHSVWVSRLAEVFTAEDKRTHARQGLFHDGSEFVLGDVTKWLKRTPEFAAYREAEDRSQAVIYRATNCPIEMLGMVKTADDLMVRVEGEYSWGPNWSSVPGYGPMSPTQRAFVEEWEPWDSRRSFDMFMRRHEEVR